MAEETPVVEEPAADTTQDPAPPQADEQDWKGLARKHERQSKQNHKRLQELEAQLAQHDEASQSEHEKAIAVARNEARDEALAEAEKDRMRDKLEVAVTRLASKSYADVEDAIMLVERAVNTGDLDGVYEDGKVQNDALQTALDGWLAEKPHLAATGNGRPQGDSDAGKGSGGERTIDQRIQEAEVAGDIQTSIALKNQKLLQIRQQQGI